MSDDIKDISEIGGISPSEYVRGIKNGNIDPSFDNAVKAILWAADEIERLREAITLAANRLDIAVAGNHGDGPACRNCVEIALSYLRPSEG